VDVGDVPERLAGVSNTRIVARDPETIGRALVELVTPPRRTNGRSRIDDFSAVEIAEQLRALYGEAASSGRR
jgi:hypothetical protein